MVSNQFNEILFLLEIKNLLGVFLILCLSEFKKTIYNLRVLNEFSGCMMKFEDILVLGVHELGKIVHGRNFESTEIM